MRFTLECMHYEVVQDTGQSMSQRPSTESNTKEHFTIGKNPQHFPFIPIKLLKKSNTKNATLHNPVVFSVYCHIYYKIESIKMKKGMRSNKKIFF